MNRVLPYGMQRRSTGTGDCLMINKYGETYKCIDNKFHPNPGTEEDSYSEIERTIDWLVKNNIYPTFAQIDMWISHRVAELVDEGYTDVEEVILEVMYSDEYTVCDKVRDQIESTLNKMLSDNSLVITSLNIDELSCARTITNYLNEHFLRVRVGGKLNPCGTDTVYFRISSHGYNWRPVITDFLWDVFKDPKDMPNYIWIGHDAETNPPEVTLFEGSPYDLVENYDTAIFCASDLI